MPIKDVLHFVRLTFKSVWALEILLFLRKGADRAWSTGDLVLQLRSSVGAVDGAMQGLRQAGLVITDEAGLHRYQPASPALDAVVAEVQSTYAQQPVTIINAILSAPDAKIRSFADAFKISKD